MKSVGNNMLTNSQHTSAAQHSINPQSISAHKKEKPKPAVQTRKQKISIDEDLVSQESAEVTAEVKRDRAPAAKRVSHPRNVTKEKHTPNPTSKYKTRSTIDRINPEGANQDTSGDEGHAKESSHRQNRESADKDNNDDTLSVRSTKSNSIRYNLRNDDIVS